MVEAAFGRHIAMMLKCDPLRYGSDQPSAAVGPSHGTQEEAPGFHHKRRGGTQPEPMATPSSSSSSEEERSTTSSTDPVIRLNVGGQRFILLKASLQKYPDSLLGKLALFPVDTLRQYASFSALLQPENEIFFDRPAALFGPIAQMYQTGHLHRSPGLCSKAFRDELVFWGILPSYVTNICQRCIKLKRKTVFQAVRKRGRIRPFREKTMTVGDGEILAKLDSDGSLSNGIPTGVTRGDEVVYRKNLPASCHPYGAFGVSQQNISPKSLYQRVKNIVWESMEGHNGGMSSVVINMISILLVMFNLALMILDSLPGYHYLDYASKIIAGADVTNGTQEQSELGNGYGRVTRTGVIALYATDWLCTIIFTIELLIRLWAAPSLIKVLKDPMVIIDILSILPAYIEAITSALLSNQVQFLAALQALRALRTFRILRVLKLARFQAGFQVIGKCLTESIPEFILLLFHLFIASLMAGSLLYYMELTAPSGSITPYATIPDGIYWSLVTYFSFADAPPVSVLGKVAAAIACILGIVLMALPVSVVVDKFSHFFSEYRKAVPEESKLGKK